MNSTKPVCHTLLGKSLLGESVSWTEPAEVEIVIFISFMLSLEIGTSEV